MSNVLVEEISLENIASAIRNKNGLSSTYTPSQMASAISAFEKSGFDINDIALRTISGNISGNALFVRDYAFYNCSLLTAASFSNCSSIGTFAFYQCISLTTVSFPNCSSIGASAFRSCFSLTTANFPNCGSIGDYAFRSCVTLTTISFPNCTYMDNYAFNYCRSLITANFPKCTSIGSYAFGNCSSLTTVNFPACSRIDNYAFSSCYNLTTASFPNCSSIGNNVFRNCFNLLSLYLNSVSVVTTLSTSAFLSTPIGGYTTSTGGVYGSVFVPASLLTSFKAATNWVSVADRIVGWGTSITINLTNPLYGEYFESFTIYDNTGLDGINWDITTDVLATIDSPTGSVTFTVPSTVNRILAYATTTGMATETGRITTSGGASLLRQEYDLAIFSITGDAVITFDGINWDDD